MTISPLLGSRDRPLRVAVVGAGPAGFYTVEALLKRSDLCVDIDLFERLPAPHGLLRYGVAPDHPKIKGVSVAYDRLCEDPRVRFLGNVGVGLGGIGVGDLVACYDEVVFATGCENGRRLGIIGEDLAGSHSATSFVGWYNGHPDFTGLEVDLGCERAVVAGIGDVAMDLARILLRPVEDLATTDIAGYALEALRGSRIREVVILARRGPAQAAFAAKELEDIAELAGIDICVDPLPVEEALAASAEKSGHDRHKLEVLARLAGHTATAPRRLVIRFLTSPVAILGSNGRVTAVRVEHNELARNQSGDLVARGTGHQEDIETGLVLRSVGYRGAALPGLPFNEERAVVPNTDGRVLHGSQVWPGVYVAGWIKRGATGVVGTNKGDAAATVARMMEDLPGQTVRPAAEVARAAIDAVLAQRGIRVVTWEAWKRIDKCERERGAAAGKPREKFTDVDEMLAAAGVADRAEVRP